MKGKKWLFRFSVIISIAAMLFTGCTSKKGEFGLSSDDPVYIKIWNYYNGSMQVAFDTVVAEFNNTVGKEKGIIVEAYSQGSIPQLETKIFDAANQRVGAEELPDMFAIYADAGFRLYNLDILADLDKYITEEEKAEYVDSYIEEGYLGKDKKFMIFPISKSSEILALNKTDWDKFAQATGASLDSLKTMEGIVAVSEDYYNWTDSLTPEANDGKAFFGRDSLANYIIVGSKQLGEEIFQENEEGSVTLNLDKDTMRRLWDNYYIPYIKGYFTSYNNFAGDDMKIGEVISYVGSTSGLVYFPQSITVDDVNTYDIESLFLNVPMFEGAENYVVQQGAGLAVKKSDEKHEYAAMVFLRYFTDIQKNIEFSVSSGYLPVKKAANNYELIEESLDKTDDEFKKDVLKRSFQITLEQNEESTLYAPPAFDNTNEARTYIETNFKNKAIEDRKKVAALLESGQSLDEAVKDFTSDENFDNWFETFSRELTDIFNK